jgi:hypothetical protein
MSNQGLGSLSFKQWLTQIGKSEKTASNYHQAIGRSISQWAMAAGLVDTNLSNIQSTTQFKPLSQAIQQLDIFQQRNSKGKGMYSAALKQFAAYLDDVTGQAITDDIEEIIGDASITETQKATLVNTRIGQGKFRESLIDSWKGCAVTQYNNSRFLVASHIKPWKDSTNEERLDPHNGLLLLPNLDKVFDLGYISFEESGAIRISAQLEEVSTLGINLAMSILLADKHQSYMAYHRDIQFKQ